jgi:hypothetical protein
MRTIARCLPGALPALVVATLALAPIRAAAYVQPPDYRRQGNASEVADPQNTTNDAVRFVTDASATGFASVTRDLRNKNLTIADLTNLVSTKYFFVDRTCAGGSPRFQLLIDRDGNHHPDGNAFGYLGEQAFGGNCPSGRWVYQDMANLASTVPNWDLSQFGGGMTNTWAQVVEFFTTTFPDHRVLACGLFDDSGSFAPGAVGTAYYDDVQCHDRVLEDQVDARPGTNTPFNLFP